MKTEMETLTNDMWERAFLLGVEYGVKMAELGNNKEATIVQAKAMLANTAPRV